MMTPPDSYLESQALETRRFYSTVYTKYFIIGGVLDISIEEMIEKLQKVSRSPQRGAVMTTMVFSALLTPRLRTVCRRHISNEVGKVGCPWWAGCCVLGHCFPWLGRKRGSGFLKPQFTSQVGYSFSNCVVKTIPWPKEKDQEQWGS